MGLGILGLHESGISKNRNFENRTRHFFLNSIYKKNGRFFSRRQLVGFIVIICIASPVKSFNDRICVDNIICDINRSDHVIAEEEGREGKEERVHDDAMVESYFFRRGRKREAVDFVRNIDVFDRNNDICGSHLRFLVNDGASVSVYDRVGRIREYRVLRGIRSTSRIDERRAEKCTKEYASYFLSGVVGRTVS